MQNTPGQEIDINPRPDQVNYVRDHWSYEGIEKITKATGLTTNEIYYTAYSLLRLKPRTITRGRGSIGYTRLEDIRFFTVIGGKDKDHHVRLPTLIRKTLGFDEKGDKIPVIVKDNGKLLQITIFKKGTPPPF